MLLSYVLSGGSQEPLEYVHGLGKSTKDWYIYLHTCHPTLVAVWHLSIIPCLIKQLHTSSQAAKLPLLYTLC